MKFRSLISLAVAAVILMAGASCRKDGRLSEANLPGAPELSLSLYVRAAGDTKAGVEDGYVSSLAAERAINKVQVWIYLSSDFSTWAAGELLGYIEPDTETYNFASGSEVKLSVPLEENFARAAASASSADKPKVTVYALINGVSAGFDDDFPSGGDWSKVTAAQLDAAVLSGNLFGTASPQTAVPDGGLPMAGYLENAPISGAFPVLSIATVQVTRLVSRIRFIFCSQRGEDGTSVDDFAISSISLSGTVGETEKIFTSSVYTPSGERLQTNIFDISGTSLFSLSAPSAAWPLPASIALNPTPYAYSRAQATDAQSWEDKIEEGLSAGVLTQWRTIYLREGGEQFAGTIKYTIGTGATAKTGASEFKLPAGGFTRNHSWVIYAYFLGGKLYVTPDLLPWEAGHDAYEYDTEGSTELKWDSYLRYQPEKDSWDWDRTWTSCAAGKRGATDEPANSPLLEVTTNHVFECWLQVDNPNFRLWQMSGATPDFTYTDCGQRIVIPAGEQNTLFYLVPDDGQAAIDDPYADVYLTVIRTDGIPPYNVPFNHDLPGAEDHTTIRFKNIGSVYYQQYRDAEKVTNRYQTYEYWVETKS